MAMLTWLPDALRAAGLDVYVMPGAETRSTWRSGLRVLGVVWHHTVTGPHWLDGHVAALLRDGRRDLAGPLAQLGVERDGTIVVIALGRANHNGYGEWGNDSVGLEFYNDGFDEPFTEQQIHAGIVATAAILGHEGLPAARAKGHRETDPKRKVDPRMSMDPIRAAVEARLQQPAPVAPPPPPPAPSPAPPATPAPTIEVCDVKVRVLRNGYKGGDVKSLQVLLNAKAGQRLNVDGDFGRKTEAAVRNVQRFFRVADDGIVGPVTWGLLFL